MRSTGGLAVLIALLLAVLLLAWKSRPAESERTDDAQLPRAQAALAALKADVASGRVVRTYVLVMPYYITTIIPVTPDSLKGHAVHQDIELTQQLADDLTQAIDSAQLQPDNVASDLRWGAIFFDQSGNPLHTIYLNGCYRSMGAGRRGLIDGVRVQLNRSLITWFESNFPNRDRHLCRAE